MAPVLTAPRRPQGRATPTGDGSERPRLKVIDHKMLRAQANRRTMYLAAGLVFVLGLFAIALAQAELVKDEHELDQMRTHLEDLEVRRTTLERDVDRASAPENIVDRALDFGMVRASEPVYLTAVHGGEAGQ